MIIVNYFTIAICEDEEFRSFAKNKERFTTGTTKDVMLKAVEVVWKAITIEAQNA